MNRIIHRNLQKRSKFAHRAQKYSSDRLCWLCIKKLYYYNVAPKDISVDRKDSGINQVLKENNDISHNDAQKQLVLNWREHVGLGHEHTAVSNVGKLTIEKCVVKLLKTRFNILPTNILKRKKKKRL